MIDKEIDRLVDKALEDKELDSTTQEDIIEYLLRKKDPDIKINRGDMDYE